MHIFGRLFHVFFSSGLWYTLNIFGLLFYVLLLVCWYTIHWTWWCTQHMILCMAYMPTGVMNTDGYTADDSCWLKTLLRQSVAIALLHHRSILQKAVAVLSSTALHCETQPACTDISAFTFTFTFTALNFYCSSLSLQWTPPWSMNCTVHCSVNLMQNLFFCSHCKNRPNDQLLKRSNKKN